MARKRGGQTWSSAAPEGAVRVGFRVEPEHVRAQILSAFDGVLEDVRSRDAYGDRSHIDEDGIHHPRGGIWNDRYGRAADGITLDHVTDAVEALAEDGVIVAWDDADAMLNEYSRTGEIPDLALMVALEGGGDAALRLAAPKRDDSLAETFQHAGITFFRRSPVGYVARAAGRPDQFILDGEERWCSCGRDRCAEIAALTDYLSARSSLAERLVSGDDPQAQIFREAVAIAERFGLGKPTKGKPGQFRNDTSAALLLIARSLYGSVSGAESVARLCALLGRSVPAARSLRRYAQEPAVAATLGRIRTVAAGLLRDLGIEPLPPATDLDAGTLSESVVSTLRAVHRLRSSAAPRKDEAA